MGIGEVLSWIAELAQAASIIIVCAMVADHGRRLRRLESHPWAKAQVKP